MKHFQLAERLFRIRVRPIILDGDGLIVEGVRLPGGRIQPVTFKGVEIRGQGKVWRMTGPSVNAATGSRDGNHAAATAASASEVRSSNGSAGNGPRILSRRHSGFHVKMLRLFPAPIDGHFGRRPQTPPHLWLG